ncbi:hypothetical protein CGRA01v4_05133 [Colletotrichum graminicola]|nr:hypothetical protein CGRA01v4_05133 [Colletotrichum graminicola]
MGGPKLWKAPARGERLLPNRLTNERTSPPTQWRRSLGFSVHGRIGPPVQQTTLERYVPTSLSFCLSHFVSLSPLLPCHLFRCGRGNRTDSVSQLIPGSGRPAVKITAALQQTAGTAGRWTKADSITYILRSYSLRLYDTLALSITLYYTTAPARVAVLSFSPFTNQGYGMV